MYYNITIIENTYVSETMFRQALEVNELSIKVFLYIKYYMTKPFETYHLFAKIAWQTLSRKG